MYRIWWKFNGEDGGVEHYAECKSVEAARRTYDALNNAGAIMLCMRP